MAGNGTHLLYHGCRYRDTLHQVWCFNRAYATAIELLSLADRYSAQLLCIDTGCKSVVY